MSNEYLAPIAIPPSETIIELVEHDERTLEKIAKIVPEINDIIENNKTVTMDIAYKLGEAFDIQANFFINLQRNYFKMLERLEKKKLNGRGEKMELLKTNIIKFTDGTYFNGVKGKVVRTTNNFKDAKTFKELNKRDTGYLRNKEYEIIEVEFSMKTIKHIELHRGDQQ